MKTLLIHYIFTIFIDPTKQALKILDHYIGLMSYREVFLKVFKEIINNLFLTMQNLTKLQL